MNYPFFANNNTDDSARMLSDALSMLFSFLGRLDGVIRALLTSNNFYEQYVIGGMILFLMSYFAFKYAPFNEMVMPLVRWADSQIDRMAGYLARRYLSCLAAN